MGKVAIKSNHLTFNGTKYFTGNAQYVTLSSYGEKATPLIGVNKLEVKDHLPVSTFNGKVIVVPPIELDTANSTKADFTAAFSAAFKAIGFTGSAGVIYDKLATNHLKLVQLWVQENDMKAAINNARVHRNNIAGDGNDARIVNVIFVVMEASFATSFTAGADFDVTADAAGIISINATGGAVVAGKSKVTLSAGTVYAYQMLKLDWLVTDTDVDEWSIN